MKTALKILLIGSIVILSACSDEIWGCGQEVIRTQNTPDQSSEMVWIARSCGATTSPLVTVYIIPKKDSLSDRTRLPKKYRVFSHERGSVDVKWGAGKTIEVVYDFSPRFGRTGQFFTQRDRVGGYDIVYLDANKEIIKDLD